MKIKEILTIDLSEDITNVIDMENIQEEELLSEIENYIVTDGLASEFDKLADVFSGNVKETGIWLSGFYGSGKSYLGKLWGYILSNPVILGTPARERILQRFTGINNESLIRNDIMALDSKNFMVIKFDIAKQNTNLGIALTMMENFLKTLNIPENAFGILLFHMMMNEKYTDVFQYIQDKSGKDWNNVRKNSLNYFKVIKEIFLANGNNESDFEAVRDSIEKDREHYGAAKLKEELELFLSIKPDVDIVFLFDEASEAINQKKFNLLDLEGISESFSAIKGRVWTMAIAQEKLDDVINNTNINRSNLTKMTDRFKTKIHIEATEVDVIIRNRLLKKTDAGKQLLEDNYTSNSGKITDTAMLVGNGLTKTDSKENYATYYPFYQYQLQFGNTVKKARKAVDDFSNRHPVLTRIVMAGSKVGLVAALYAVANGGRSSSGDSSSGDYSYTPSRTGSDTFDDSYDEILTGDVDTDTSAERSSPKEHTVRPHGQHYIKNGKRVRIEKEAYPRGGKKDE